MVHGPAVDGTANGVSCDAGLMKLLRRSAWFTVALAACAATSAAGLNLSERETSHDHLIVVHYPSDFLKFFVGENIHLAGPKGGSQLADMYFSVESRPSSEDLNELARTTAFCPEETSFTVPERSVRPASCFGGRPGLERYCLRSPTTRPKGMLFVWECMFVKNHHLFRFGYTMPTTIRAEVEPVLRRVLAAAEAN